MIDSLEVPLVAVGRRAVCVAREPRAGYAAGSVVPAVPTAAEALDDLDRALKKLARVDWNDEPDASVNDAALVLQRVVNRVEAQALRPLAAMQQRSTYAVDGAVTASSWLRNRANLDPAASARVCTAARRLTRLPRLAAAFRAGDVSLAHVTAVTEAAVPNRFDAISAVEATLVDLARTAKPHAVRAAIRAVRDVVDADGADAVELGDDEPCDADETDPRRFWRQHPTIDGMTAGEYCVDGVFGEMLALLFDAFGRPDPPDTPLRSRRSPAQRRCDAIRAAVWALLNSGVAPTVQGAKPHLLMMLDLLTVMGRDQAAVFAAELARTGRVSAATIARLGFDAKVTPVLTMGPWRVVAVGQTQRTLPAWLRPMLQMLHRHCRGPDCDRPAAWTQAHHETAWADGGDTDLNQTIPLCHAHHNLVTHHGWTVTQNLDNGTATWTAPNGRVITTYPHR